ncbi:N-6 DNA methylase [Candidatus Peregrinibacteria bacterium]|nr:N-6 DNA methylase [Candidatus Peregrinibacteria bacterium]
MNKQQAQKLIRETFETPFDKSRFNGFVRNLLNHIEEAPFTYKGNYIPEAYRQYIKTLERIGKYRDGEHNLDILIITLQKETSLERARTMQRNFIAWYLNGSRGGTMKDAALVAYVAPTLVDWRFSLVKMDYKFEKTKNGKMKVKEEFTPARRWSFLVGSNEKSHTAQSRLVKILADDEHTPTLDELEEAFNIETVTKEFFLKYRELFIHTKEALDEVVKNNPKVKADFETKGVDTVNFAKKLLGQIVFLYFLQKKGWFGVGRDDDWGNGSKQFLRELFRGTHGSYQNLFNDILEPLFYEALRIDRNHDDDYYSRFNCKIPFLNGGLFDPIGNYDWVHTDIHLPNDIFSNERKMKEGDTGNGILDVFDRYNFTVREDEPLEKEVAIDPELLGKAYEKFNAIRPDNFDEFTKVLKSGKKGEESKFDKKFGVYYTPREIVHYMCKQSLINYLATRAEDTQLDTPISKQDIEDLIEVGELITEHEATVLIKEQNIKAGIQKQAKYTSRLSDGIRGNAKIIDGWLEEITVCDPAVGSGAFPVGMMAEIVRLRSVLSVFLQDGGRSDYDFKRRCIEHSLYGVDIDPGAVEIAKLRLWLSLVVDEENIKNIKPLPNLDYKIVCGNSLLGVEKDLFNLQLFNDLEKYKPLFFSETNPTKKQEYKKQIDDLINQITNGHTEFDFEVYFSEVFHNKCGFDVVIANPPYLNVELVPKEQKEYFAKKYKTFYKRYDVFGLFFELSLTNLINKKGTVTFIIPQQIFNNLSYKKLRDLMLDNHWLSEVFYLGNKIFEASNDVCVLFLKKPHSDKIRLVNALDFKQRVTTEVPADHFKKYGNVISFSHDAGGERIFDKIFDKKHERIKERFDVFQGIVTGNNTAFLPNLEQIRNAEIEKGLLHPVLLGRDFEKWFIRSTERRILYVNGGTDITKFPNSKEWLSQFRSKLTKRRECQRGIIPWYSLQWPRVKAQLDRVPKILVQGTRNPRLETRVVATMDEIGVYGTQGLNFIVPKIDDAPIYYLLAVLNSNLINYLYATKFLNVAIKAEYLKDTPIPKPNTDQEKALTDLVKKILAITKTDDYLQNPQKQSTVKELEREVDQMVYKLYGLSEEEIQIVEGSTK